LEREHRVRLHVHGDDEVTRLAAALAGATLAAQADLLAVLHARGDASVDCPALDVKGHGGARRGLPEGECRCDADVGALAGCGAEAAAAEHAAEDVLEAARAAATL